VFFYREVREGRYGFERGKKKELRVLRGADHAAAGAAALVISR
jgi:hypothetical protein